MLVALSRQAVRLASSSSGRRISTLELQARGEQVRIKQDELTEFAMQCLKKAGASESHARLHAEVIFPEMFLLFISSSCLLLRMHGVILRMA